jgi:hypothetical protein
MRCPEADALTSESLDRNLDLSERLALRMHRMVCHSCRQFKKQLQFVRRSCQVLQEREQAQLESGPSLEPEVKERLKRLLDKNING